MAKSKVSGSNGLNFTAKLDINEAKRNALELQKLFRELNISTSKGLDPKAMSGYQQGMLNLRKALADSQKQTEELRQENLRLRNEYEKGRITGQDYRNEIAKINLERKKEVEAARLARKAAEEVAGSYALAQKRLRELGVEIRGTENGMKRLTPELKAKIKEYNDLNDALKKFDEKMGNHQRKVGDYRGAIRGASEDLLSFATTYLSLGNALVFVFDKTLAFQRIKTPLSYILGSEGEANNKLAELKNFADEVGVQYFTIANTYRSFTAAARASNFDLDQSEKIFRSVTKASAVLGLSSDELAGSLLAVQQMISKGTVQAEELRGQLSERLPGAFALAAKAMGVTEAELSKLLQTGDVVASDLLPKLATELDKAYGDKAAEGVRGLNAELARLKTELEAGAGDNSALSKKLFEPIIIGAREAIKEISQMFRGSFSENIRYFFTFSNKSLANQRLAYDLRDSRNNNQNAQTAAEQYSTEGKSVADLKTKYDQLTATMRQAIDAQKKFKAGVSSGDLKETKDASIVQYTAIANGLIAQRKRVGDAYLELKKQQKGAIKEIADSQLTSIAEIRKRINELQKLSGSAIIGGEINNRIKALQERLKKPASAKDDFNIVNQQRTMQAEIDALTKKGRAKRLSDDEQELADVDAKYKKLREKAIAFNSNPKNKAKGLKVDTGGLALAQSDEEDALRDKQASEKLKITLDKQKKYYEEFEQYRVTYGEEKAKERYKNLIDTDKSYLQKLKEMEDDILNPEKSKGADNLYDGKSEKQLKELRESIEAETQAEQKKNDALLKEFMDYSQKRKVLIETYNRDYADLANSPNEQVERTRRYNKDLKELDDANGKKIDSYRELFTGIESLSRKSALKLLESGRVDFAKQIKAGNIVDPKQIAEIKTYFNDVENTIRNGSGQALIDLARQVDGVASEVSKLDESFGKIVGTLGNVLGQLGNVKSGIASIKIAQGKGDIFGQLSSGLGIFGAGLSIFQSIAGLFDKSAQREEQASYAREIQNKQTEALNKALERQIALLNDVYGTERIANYSEAIKQAQENQAKYSAQLTSKYSLSGNKQLDDIISKINNGEGTGVFGLSVDAFIKTNQAALDKLKLPTDLQSLQRLLDEGKLDANTSNIVTNLLKAKQTAEELVNSLRAERVGAGLNTIVDEFMSSLTDGTTGFEASLTKSIRRGLLNGLQGELTQKYIQDFYSTLDKALADGSISSDEDAELKALYKAAEEYGKKKLEYIDKIAPDDSKKPNGSNQSGGNVISRELLKEETGQRLEGIWRAQYELTKNTNLLLMPIGKSIGDLFQVTRDSFAIQVRIEANTFRTANNTDQLNNKLDAIIANTKPTVTPRGAGI